MVTTWRQDSDSMVVGWLQIGDIMASPHITAFQKHGVNYINKFKTLAE